jgi:Ca2+-transporting ATPase
MENPWELPFKEVIQNLSVIPEKGLSPSEARSRLKQTGPNSLHVHERVTYFKILVKQLKSPVILILILATLISFFLEERVEAIAILSVVVINIFVGVIQESKAGAAIAALAKLSAPKAKVLRDSQISVIPSSDVCPGDILVLEAGDYVPADARIISAHQLSVDEAILTGESLPVDKVPLEIPRSVALSERTNMLFAGTAISTGSTKAIVTATGQRTELGKIADLMKSAEPGPTPLQVRLEVVGKKLLYLGLVITLIVSMIGLYHHWSWNDVVMSALSLAIAAIPEGLPTIVTVALVMAVHRMSKRNALVRKMDAVESLGATDIICTDKTGTLTSGKMTVRETYLLHDSDHDLFLQCLILCNNASLSSGQSGDTTEIALLRYGIDQAKSEPGVRENFPRVFEWSFDSHRKRMSVAVKHDQRLLLFSKGAPEYMIPRCEYSFETTEVLKKVETFSEKGMRVLALAWRELGPKEIGLIADEVEKKLNFIGLVAIADTPRPEAMEAIRKCKASGIRVIMITGDHPKTAAAVASELGLATGDDIAVITGAELEIMPEESLREKVEAVSVYARVSPDHKLKLVSTLKELGHIVAMTGDGVNDAPALKLASIGVAMGKGGTEVARQASAMILTDDNFATIVDAVEEGRAVNGNIKRTLQYLLSHNLAELLFILATTVIGLPTPLLPLNLLWLNLVTDGFPALALAGERVPKEFLSQTTGPSKKSFFDRSFYQELFFVASIITFMASMIYRYAYSKNDLITARSLSFNFLVYVGLMRSFSCRSDIKTYFEMGPNIYHLVSVLFPICIQLLLQQWETLRTVFEMKQLSLMTNFLLLLLATIPVSLVEISKIWKRHESSRFKNDTARQSLGML